MRLLRTAVLLLCVVSGLGFSPADAGHPGGPACGAGYVGSASCQFTYRGTPLRVTGESNASSASVRVWVEVYGNPELGPILECRAAASTKARCSEQLPEDGPVFDIPDRFATFFLVCRVQGAGFGTYRCMTGSAP